MARHADAAVVRGAAHLMAERVLELGVTLFDEAVAGGAVGLPSLDARLHQRHALVDGAVQVGEVVLVDLRHVGLAVAQQVVGALDVGAVAVHLHAEIEVDEVALLRAAVAGAGVPDDGIRPDEHAGILVVIPRVVHAVEFDAALTEVVDVLLRHALGDEVRHFAQDLLGHLRGLADAADLLGRLAPAQLADDALGRDDLAVKAAFRKQLLQVEVHAVRQAVGRDVARVVQRDGLRRETLHHVGKALLEVEAVAHDLVVGLGLLEADVVELARQRDAAALARDEHARHAAEFHRAEQLQDGVVVHDRLAGDDEPDVHALLFHDAAGLAHFFLIQIHAFSFFRTRSQTAK